MWFFQMMHTRTARLTQTFGGLWLVIYGAGLTAGYAFPLAILGAGIAVTAIADICLAELLFARKRDRLRADAQIPLGPNSIVGRSFTGRQ